MNSRRYICTHCRQRQGIDITYGMPGIELADMVERGKHFTGEPGRLVENGIG